MPMVSDSKLLPSKEINILTGKSLVGALTKEEQLALCDHITELEIILNELDLDDVFGPEGWRHHFGIDE